MTGLTGINNSMGKGILNMMETVYLRLGKTGVEQVVMEC